MTEAAVTTGGPNGGQLGKPSSDEFQAKRTAMLSGPIASSLLRLTLPVIAVIAAQTFVAVLEAFWVSKLGTVAVAGVSLVLPLQILMNTMSNGGIGGGVSSAVSRALGAGNIDDANKLLWHTVVIALGFGMLFAFAAVVGGPAIYRALGGSGEVLDQCLVYSAWVFIGSPIIWTVNLLGSAMRGAGDVKVPALVSLFGAAILVPLSPALIFGVGPLPKLGVGGAGAATILFYGGALVIYAVFLGQGRGMLRFRRTYLEKQQFGAILGVGLISAVGTLVASLTVVGITGAVGHFGASALAGYGIASRIDSLLIPLLFGLGSGVVTLVGVATGASNHARAKAVTVFAVAAAFVFTESIGILFALLPDLWMYIFTADLAVIQVGDAYLHTVAPFYGFFGVGLMLYFASQGRSQMMWPFVAGGMRLLVVVGGALSVASQDDSLSAIFIFVSLGSILFGGLNWWGVRRGFSEALKTDTTKS